MKKINNQFVSFLLGACLTGGSLVSCSSKAGEKYPEPRRLASDKKIPVEDPNYGNPGTCYFCDSKYDSGYLAGSSVDGGNYYDIFGIYPNTSYNVDNNINYIFEKDPDPVAKGAIRLTVRDVKSRFTIPGSGSNASQDLSPSNGDQFVQEAWSNEATPDEKRQGGALILIRYHLVLNGATTGARFMTIDERNGQRIVSF